MLTGKKAYAFKAKKLGLVDKVTTKEALLNAAIEFALKLTAAPYKRVDNRTFVEKLFESNSLTRAVIFRKAKEMVLKKTWGNYPAPLKILECVEIGYDEGMEKGLSAEAEKFEELVLTNVSHQLINVFFAMTEKKKNPYAGKAEIKNTDNIAVIGAGFMGEGITQVSVMDGINVMLKDIKEGNHRHCKKNNSK